MKKYYLYLILISFSIGCQKKQMTLDDTMQKSITWIWAQQAEDGGWHSKTHKVLEDGKVLTPYILFQLAQIKNSSFEEHKEQTEKAIHFIIASVKSSLNTDSTSLIEYPNYSAAYDLRVLHKLNRDTSLQKIIAQYLLKQQFTEQRGFTKDSLAYGGWGYGEPDLKNGEHGHEDMSHTRRVTQALVEYGHLPDSLRNDIVLFLNGTQRSKNDSRLYEGCLSRSKLPYDGGFVSSVVTLATNKSQAAFIEGAGYHYPSYATATCDGLIAMHALHMDTTQAFHDAENWLKKNQNYTTIDGLSVNDPEQWTYVMHFYHLSVRAEAMQDIDPHGAWRDSISMMLIKEQLPEGDYLNPLGGVNKEDDPLVSTIFCIQAGNDVLNSGEH
ncbi:MAG: hypothetical protein IPP15_14845 [Saprospiraceae bacterium]|uniref:Uncharacterized protein n=1 Tax=Candidatus Opimibacter skivensis TaxID=2982028 RepID=A0A9D7XNQ5_9BACT|nr:hypothetical protein [Candidatus Opimibacter skivensis]